MTSVAEKVKYLLDFMGIICKGLSEWKLKKLLHKSGVQTALQEQLGGQIL